MQGIDLYETSLISRALFRMDFGYWQMAILQRIGILASSGRWMIYDPTWKEQTSVYWKGLSASILVGPLG